MPAPFQRLGAFLRKPMQGSGMGLNPVTQSVLAQQLLAQSMQSPQGLVSPSGVLNKALQGLLARQTSLANEEAQRTTSARQQALAGALSRASAPIDPSLTGDDLRRAQAKAEAGRRASSMLAGGLPGDPLAQKLLGAQAESTFSPPQGKDLFGVVDPSSFTPESLQKFSQTKQYGDLIPRENIYGRYTPGNYTTESWAAFKQSGDPAALELRPEFRFQQTPSGAVVAGNTVTGQTSPTAVTPQVATDEAATRKRAEAQASAEGSAVGAAEGAILSRALKAEGINDILDIAEPLIDEATGSGTGAARDKLAAFFGVSTTGAQATAQLLPLQAAIMLNQPRMEGPQSDRDVQLYREAAGQLGDPSVPRETKKAAIQTIRRLQQQYSGTKSTGAMPDLSKMSDEELRRLAGGQ